jgi:hypothetical protein
VRFFNDKETDANFHNLMSYLPRKVRYLKGKAGHSLCTYFGNSAKSDINFECPVESESNVIDFSVEIESQGCENNQINPAVFLYSAKLSSINFLLNNLVTRGGHPELPNICKILTFHRFSTNTSKTSFLTQKL